MSDFETLREAVIAGNAAKAMELTKEELGNGVSPQLIIDRGLIPAMEIVGKKFQEEELFLPELLLAGRAMLTSTDILKPTLVGARTKKMGSVVIGTVKGDMHSIGKNIVAMMLEGAGFEVHDLEVDVSPDKFVDALRNTGAVILGLSSLLSTTTPMMSETIKAVQTAGLASKVKIIVGGAPITQEFANRIGADGYAKNAAEAVNVAKGFVSG